MRFPLFLGENGTLFEKRLVELVEDKLRKTFYKRDISLEGPKSLGNVLCVTVGYRSEHQSSSISSDLDGDGSCGVAWPLR